MKKRQKARSVRWLLLVAENIVFWGDFCHENLKLLYSCFNLKFGTDWEEDARKPRVMQDGIPEFGIFDFQGFLITLVSVNSSVFCESSITFIFGESISIVLNPEQTRNPREKRRLWEEILKQPKVLGKKMRWTNTDNSLAKLSSRLDHVLIVTDASIFTILDSYLLPPRPSLEKQIWPKSSLRMMLSSGL